MLALCRAWGALLIVNDAPELSAEIGADGVHLGQAIWPLPKPAVSSARGDRRRRPIRSSRSPRAATGRLTISASVRFAIRRPKNLAPVLGAEGYRSILERMRQGIAAGRRDRGHFTRGRARADAFGRMA
ncbi:MAG: thiamine phosphate synthase [Alistipes sp.]